MKSLGSPVIDDDLTLADVARMLNMARPLVARRMEAGDLPFHQGSDGRRCRRADVLAFRAAVEAQRAALRELAADADDLTKTHGL